MWPVMTLQEYLDIFSDIQNIDDYLDVMWFDWIILHSVFEL